MFVSLRDIENNKFIINTQHISLIEKEVVKKSEYVNEEKYHVHILASLSEVYIKTIDAQFFDKLSGFLFK